MALGLGLRGQRGCQLLHGPGPTGDAQLHKEQQAQQVVAGAALEQLPHKHVAHACREAELLDDGSQRVQPKGIVACCGFGCWAVQVRTAACGQQCQMLWQAIQAGCGRWRLGQVLAGIIEAQWCKAAQAGVWQGQQCQRLCCTC